MNNNWGNIPHTAQMVGAIAEADRKMEEKQQKKERATIEMQNNIRAQKINQEGMVDALCKLVDVQNETNEIMKEECNALIKQNELLQQQNLSQAKELQKQRLWNWITYGITTMIALASVVASFISIFK